MSKRSFGHGEGVVQFRWKGCPVIRVAYDA